MREHYVWVTTRRLQPGTLEDFERAWRPEPAPQGLHRAYAYWSEDGQEVTGVSFWDSREACDAWRASEQGGPAAGGHGPRTSTRSAKASTAAANSACPAAPAGERAAPGRRAYGGDMSETVVVYELEQPVPARTPAAGPPAAGTPPRRVHAAPAAPGRPGAAGPRTLCGKDTFAMAKAPGRRPGAPGSRGTPPGTRPWCARTATR
ncbi:hypothetical protein LT493_44950 [Streptomyces tricolor]|nr:hypothetical protein [Streptomyces tricolor]